MPPIKVPSLEELGDLAQVFPENQFHAAPIAEDYKSFLPAPGKDMLIPLPKKNPRPKVVIADDDPNLIHGLQHSLELYYKEALDVRYWQPQEQQDLLETLEHWKKNDGWHPDVVVIDINFSHGGKHGLHYLQELRRKKGSAAKAVVLATGNQYSDLDQNKLSTGTNLTQVEPSEWLKLAKAWEPEAILYGKTGDARFLGRIGENVSTWQLVARRRTWVKLLQAVAEKLDAPSIKVEEIAQVIVDFAVEELRIDDAFVRQRLPSGLYKLLAKNSRLVNEHLHTDIDIGKVPLLKRIIENNREPIRLCSISKEDAGVLDGEITGKRFLGINALLGDRNAGFITLFRNKEQIEFESEDEPFLKVLARLLASALRVALLRDKQTGLLKFANLVAEAETPTQVCEYLAETLHREIHDNQDSESKITVRLVDFGTGELKREKHLGLPVDDAAIFFTTQKSINARVVRENSHLCSGEFSEDGHLFDHSDYLETLVNKGCINSELCVPLSIGKSSMGAVNLEHKKNDFYLTHDSDFVQAAATLAANAIERIRKAKLLEGMTDFALRFAYESNQKLEQRLHNLLYEFCGYSVLVDLKPSDDEPWQIQNIDCRFKGSDKNSLRAELDKCFINPKSWRETWVSQRIKMAGNNDWAWFNDEPQTFKEIDLTPDLIEHDPKAGEEKTISTPQKSDALLLVRHGNKPAHRAFLLMWALSPPMSADDIRLLKNLARLFSELDSRQHTVNELIQKSIMDEQAVGIAHVMQHFRHRLGNLTGSQTTHIDNLAEAYDDNDPNNFQQALQSLRANAKDIANSFHKSKGYIKVPELRPVAVDAIVESACKDLKRLEEQGVVLKINVTKNLIAYTDSDIASLVLYSLLENALDATEGKQDASVSISAEVCNDYIALRISDNGGGVPEHFRAKLFTWGQTTKAYGLGSALAFARTRMEQIQGKLIFPVLQPEQGAVFEMQLALATERLCHD